MNKLDEKELKELEAFTHELKQLAKEIDIVVCTPIYIEDEELTEDDWNTFNKNILGSDRIVTMADWSV